MRIIFLKKQDVQRRKAARPDLCKFIRPLGTGQIWRQQKIAIFEFLLTPTPTPPPLSSIPFVFQQLFWCGFDFVLTPNPTIPTHPYPHFMLTSHLNSPLTIFQNFNDSGLSL